MADRYWVGGSGTWDATTTTNWSATTGGAGGASAPTLSDNVIFNSLSNATLYTVTVGTNATCANFTVGAPLTGAVTFSLGATAVINCYGSMTLPATNCTWSATAGAFLNFYATTTGKTITSNGVSIANTSFNFLGIGGEWTLGSALTINNFFFNSGTFNTANFNCTGNSIQRTSATNTATINLGSSTVTVTGTTPVNFTAPSGLTFNAGTSQITCSNNSPTLTGGGLTFYNVTFSSTAFGTAQITGANTFNNLATTARAAAGYGLLVFPAASTTTINGTLTLASGTTGVARLLVAGTSIGSTATISVATLAAMTDVDFRNIIVTGAASPISGTRIGNCLGNSGITFTGARTVYWVSAASANWNAAVWNTSSGTTGGATTNFPLAQDTIVIDNAGLTTGNTITLNLGYSIPNLDFSSRSNAATFATGGANPVLYGDLIYSSAITVSGTATLTFAKQSGTATITSAARTFTQILTINAPSGTVRINNNLTLGSTLTTTLTSGTLDLTNNGAGNYVLTTGLFNSNNSNTRAITFGTGNITLTGNNASILVMGTVTGFSYTGTPTFNATYSGSVGTRQIGYAGTTGGNETNAISLNVSAGSDILNLFTHYKNLNFTGFSGSLNNNAIVVYGNLIVSTGMTLTAGTSPMYFNGTSGTQQITTNGKTLDFSITQDGTGGTVQPQDNITLGSTRTYTLTNGTLSFNGKTISTGLFITSNSNARTIAFGNGTLTLTSAGTAFDATTATNLTVTGQTTGTIDCTSSSTKTFAGGGLYYPKINQGGLGNLQISGANTFYNMTNTVQPATITFPASTITNFYNFNVNGIAGNLVSLVSSTPGTRYTLNKL